VKGIIMAEKIWNEWFDIRSFEIDFKKRASIQALCSFFQETAGNHVQDLGISIETLISQGMTWILSRFHIRVHRYPVWREHIRIETWPSDAYSFYALRDFNIFDEQDHLLVSASSLWLILDLKTRHPLRIPDHILKMQVKDRERALYDPFDTSWRPQQVMLEKRFSVRRSDLDLNQHVNNVRYVEWAVETVPDEIWQAYQLTEIEVSFRMESLYGDVIISQNGQAEEDGYQVFTHRIIRESDEHELFLARTRWMK
jgi:medium-chain acyl-[acyl-carrier-protein] hydrolase